MRLTKTLSLFYWLFNVAETYIKSARCEEAWTLLKKNYHAFILLWVIAQRARRIKDEINKLEIGEAMIGDFENYGMSKQNYRTAKKILETCKLVTLKVTNKGTIAKIIDTRIYDININESNQQTNIQLTHNQHTANTQLTPNNNDNNDKEVKNDKENIYSPIFDFWNSKNIIVHRNLTDKMKRKLQAVLKDKTQEEILCAIDNYATVLKSNDYYWTHEWTLEDFLSRGLDKFIEEAHPLTNFLIKERPKELRKKNYIESANQNWDKKPDYESDNTKCSVEEDEENEN